MSGFTPGPWQDDAANRVVCQADGQLICILRDPDDVFSDNETLANGRLIAAAPNLYEALAAFVNGDCGDNIDTRYENARQVLAKARGEQA